MRRILRKIVAGEMDTIGDTSTLADPSIVDVLIEKVEALKTKEGMSLSERYQVNGW
jgi:acetyl-CoA synthetase